MNRHDSFNSMIRQATVDVITWLDEQSQIVLTPDSRPTASPVSGTAAAQNAVRDALVQLAGEQAVHFASPDGRTHDVARRRDVEDQLRQALDARDDSDLAFQRTIEMTGWLVQSLWSVIANHATALAETPPRSNVDLRRGIAEALALARISDVAVTAAHAVMLDVFGTSIEELWIEPPGGDEFSVTGSITFRATTSDLETAIRHRWVTTLTEAFRVAQHDLLSAILTTSRRLRQRQATLGDLVHHQIALERAIDAVTGPLDPALRPALAERAAHATHIALVCEHVTALTTGVAIPRWWYQEKAAIELARLAPTSAEAMAAFAAQRPHAVALFVRHRDQIRAVTIALLESGSMGRDTFRRLVDEAGTAQRQ